MPRLKQFDKEEVLEKAKTLFWKQGFHATSIQNLVDHLGINRASIYDTFGGKNELYELALTSYRNENIQMLLQHFDKVSSVKKALRKLMVDAIQYSFCDDDSKGCFVINCTTEYLPHYPDFLTEVLDNKNQFQKIIRSAIELGQEKGEISKQLISKDIALYFYTFFSGLKIVGKIKRDKKELLSALDLAMKVLDT